ncbi:uncharacterized protein LOC107273373 isoform X1 [Cephus cinctus]|uniref:Uncharacterized protein LOC107273373 isoform X1 n=1 Tax=Cephus cinctus TaxID=211228 RepID=A0AAJ7W6R2_CEPCN|nr:uncharacterized protein LOC107273373 isoform X1 [Cephus cinctus]XP_015606991.1 uncharacterized protein LOC107273373 isoform X1 [Cephus cinctus]XP_015606992.1 uncharacterized protein LOC107273373 isoform X1 [Cephus cinctus]XP_015606993.1 uncharacterized protein LOC107273373 isoform X1 [Cephus cinctus]XP_024946458.1 uncharacterized protein LOC107273373 isoform X1 [Cephus cinctus]XP_024946459.1 uncharacterized protein LOC107273373 isoform X1 [Cephus cinctus]XP_024946460.1 uncharacterized prot
MYGDGELETVSEPWRVELALTTATDDNEHFCKLILYKEIKDSRVRIWDVVILIPNLLFLLFIAVRFNRARLKLRATSSPIFLAFYGLVLCNIVISVIRCAVSMTVNAAASVGGKADKVLWVTVRFFLLSTEMSVVIFSLFFGHLDSRSSIRRVLLATSFIALAFTITQGTLELILPDDTFHIPSRNFYVFGHGGMMFWFCSSIVFTLIYLFILILPWTRLRERFALPNRKSFYVYAGALAILDLAQSIGAGLLNYTQNPAGLCVVDLTAAVYLTLFTPLVYHTFLSEFFGVSQPSIMFSYKTQVDDAMDEDTVSLPHQQSFSSLKTDSDYIYQVHTPPIHMPLYDSPMPKSSAFKSRRSMYSLTPRRDPKSAKAGRSSSQVTLYGTSPGAKALGKRHNILKSTSDLGNTSPLTRSENLVGVQKSTPNLNFDNRPWNASVSSKIKYPGATSISNLVLLPNTASNFIYRPKGNDSTANLFSASSKSSLENTAQELESSDGAYYEFPGTRRESSTRSSVLENPPSRSSETMPPLESNLRNILDSGTLEYKECQEEDEEDSEDGRLSLTSFVQSSARKFKVYDDKSIFGRLQKSRDFESASLGPGSTINDSAEVLNVTSGPSPSRNTEYRSERTESGSSGSQTAGGLSDYLQSLNSPKYQS